MLEQEPTNNQIMQTVDKTMEIVSGVKENTEQILEAIGMYSNHVDESFNKVYKRLNKIEKDIGGIKTDVTDTQSSITSIKANMVTKDYLDEKLGTLKGDLVATIRKSEKKFVALVDELQGQKVLPKESIKRILVMGPYPLDPIVEVK